MRNFFSILLIACSALLFSQESISFENTPFKEILAKAKKEKKLVFMDAYASWCGPCKMMERNVFPQEAVKKYFNANFINSRFDMEKGEGRDIAMKYGIRSYPTFLFLNGDGEVVLKNFGYMDEGQFLAFAKEANNPKYKTNSNRELYEKGEKNPETLLNMMKLYAETDYDFAKKVSERYFGLKKKAPLTKEEVNFLLYFTKSTADSNYKVFAEKKPEIIQLMPEDLYRQFDNNIKLSNIMESSVDQKTATINDEYFLKNAVPLVGKDEAATALNRMKVLYYPNTGNFAQYEKAALQYYKDSDKFDPQELLQAAWNFSEHISNPASLKTAVEWAEKSVIKSETPENTFILAKLYAKTGKKEQAVMYAEMAQHLAAAQGQDSTLAKKLLETLK